MLSSRPKSAWGGFHPPHCPNRHCPGHRPGAPWRYVRIYGGIGQGQVAEIDVNATIATEITVTKVWRFQNSAQTTAAIVDGVGIVPSSGWLAGAIPDDTSNYVLVPSSRMWEGYDTSAQEWVEFPALIAAKEVGEDEENLWLVSNQPAQQNIDSTEATLQGALAGVPVDFIAVPAIYLGSSASGSREAFAYLPGLVNIQVWNNQLWLPKPFGPRFPDLLDREDTFEIAANGVLEQGPRTTHYIDNWDTYHRNFGEVHCGTSVLRVPLEEYQIWWEYQQN